MAQGSFKHSVLRETALFVVLLFVGFVIAPIAIYWIGPEVLGEFGGAGYADFFGTLSARVRTGDIVAWFFILSPYLALQALRLTWFAWRITGGATN
ncbi:MAG: hypothetical protein GTO71_03530 [Woeseiaceae bacterium]|nr:hypothetical protein [Woeseiaceae bacterium]NIP20181.1 hypothetical protein [Woeseiaceae bacterium]NIS88977.1 hypothetical protein [Woeseiaceae bacterium]